MKIIGHRGAAGLAPENTIKAIKAGIAAGADAIEFDVRLTKDEVFVLSHDSTFDRLAGAPERVRNLTLTEIKALMTFDGEQFTTLDEALKACEKVTAVIEAKGKDWAEPLVKALEKHLPNLDAVVISFNSSELGKFHELMPSVPCYILERQNAFKIIGTAHSLNLTGVDLNFWILNPFTYTFAKLYKLDVLTYTVDRPGLMRWFAWMYPHVGITTNYPNVLSKIKK